MFDEDILALVSDEVHQPEKLWDLLDLQVRLPLKGILLHLTFIHPKASTPSDSRLLTAHVAALRCLNCPGVCMRHKPGAHSRASLQVVCGTMGLPTATVRMRGPDGIARTSTGMGTGPVDAAMKAIDSQVRVQVTRPQKWTALTAALVVKACNQAILIALLRSMPHETGQRQQTQAHSSSCLGMGSLGTPASHPHYSVGRPAAWSQKLDTQGLGSQDQTWASPCSTLLHRWSYQSTSYKA